MEADNKKKVIEFIRIAILRPEQRDSILPHIVKASPSLKSEEEVEWVLQNAEREILSDDYLSTFVPTVEEIFSPTEIEKLLEFYRDPTIDKYFKQGGSIGSSVYSLFSQVVQKEVEALQSTR